MNNRKKLRKNRPKKYKHKKNYLYLITKPLYTIPLQKQLKISFLKYFLIFLKLLILLIFFLILMRNFFRYLYAFKRCTYITHNLY